MQLVTEIKPPPLKTPLGQLSSLDKGILLLLAFLTAIHVFFVYGNEVSSMPSNNEWKNFLFGVLIFLFPMYVAYQAILLDSRSLFIKVLISGMICFTGYISFLIQFEMNSIDKAYGLYAFNLPVMWLCGLIAYKWARLHGNPSSE